MPTARSWNGPGGRCRARSRWPRCARHWWHRARRPTVRVTIPGFNPPIVPLSDSSAPIVTQLDYDHERGRFTALLSVSGKGMDPIALRVSGEVADVIDLPVAVSRLSTGAVPGPDDIRIARVRVASVHTDVARDPAMVIGMQMKRQIQAGAPIALSDMMQPTQITRGDPVRLRLQVGGLSLTGQGTALESGAAGERIRVRKRLVAGCAGGGGRWTRRGACDAWQRADHLAGAFRDRFRARRLIMRTRRTVALVLCLAVAGCGSLQRLSEVGRAPQLTKASDPTKDPDYRPLTMADAQGTGSRRTRRTRCGAKGRGLFSRISARLRSAISLRSWCR